MCRFKDMLLDRHKGETAILVANGPSLNKMDMALLKGKTLIGLNKIFLGFETFGIYPTYYVAVNPYVIEQSRNEIAQLKAVKFLGDRDSNDLIKEDALTYILNTKNPPSRFCEDIAIGVHEGWTVTYAALQIAYYLGFQKVYIVGLDHRFSYEGKENELKVLAGEDVNHFSGLYFGYGQQWQNPDLIKSEESFLIARDFFKKNGRQIIDLTIDGGCSIFDKADYSSALARW